MKPAACFLVFALLLSPFLTSPAAASAPPNLIILTADQVQGAMDIEMAINDATQFGSRPGTVILDGRHGPFVYTTDDRSLNIFVSNLTLRGQNGAQIENCADGLFFDDFPLRYVLVEGITFICEAGGVVAPGAFRNVTLRGNVFHSGAAGISLGGASRDWLIANNIILADGDGLRIDGSSRIVILNNRISGFLGVALMNSAESQVRYNLIQAAWQGVLLGQESWKNMVKMNTIYGVEQSGIALEPGVTGSIILSNQVACAPGADCLTVDAMPEVAAVNKILLNVP